MLCNNYKNMINLTRTLYSRENLTKQFTTSVTKTKDHIYKCEATITDYNTLTTQVAQLKAQLMQTLTLLTTTRNSFSTSHKGQTDPKKFTGENHLQAEVSYSPASPIPH
jgi:formyltetrahydrofolate synthetase